jgi:hypothetical protein
MKQKTDKLMKLFIFNVLFLTLAVVITINLFETGGKAVLQETSATVQSAS